MEWEGERLEVVQPVSNFSKTQIREDVGLSEGRSNQNESKEADLRAISGVPQTRDRQWFWSAGLVVFFLFFNLGRAAWLAESQFPDQGSNPGRGSESTKS